MKQKIKLKIIRRENSDILIFEKSKYFFFKVHNLTIFDQKLNFMEQKWILVPVCIKEEVK